MTDIQTRQSEFIYLGFELASSGYRFAALPVELPRQLNADLLGCALRPFYFSTRVTGAFKLDSTSLLFPVRIPSNRSRQLIQSTLAA